MGMPAKSFVDASRLARLPPTKATIVIPTRRHTLGERTSERLLQWVEAGGNLVVVTWTLWDDPNREPDPILDPLGVRQFMNDANDPAAPEKPDPNAPPVVGTVEFPDRDTPLEARFDPRFYFELDPEAKRSSFEVGDD
jgi:hypothetical protein